MNSIFYIIGFFIIALFLVGIIVSLIKEEKKKKEYKKLINNFENFAIRNRLTIDRKEVIHKYIIGIDRLNSKLGFLDRSTMPGVFHLINLKDISTCRLIKQRSIDTGLISRIILKCIFIKKTRQPIELLFYDEIDDDISKMMQLSRKASYWGKSIHIFRETARLSAQRI